MEQSRKGRGDWASAGRTLSLSAQSVLSSGISLWRSCSSFKKNFAFAEPPLTFRAEWPNSTAYTKSTHDELLRTDCWVYLHILQTREREREREKSISRLRFLFFRISDVFSTFREMLNICLTLDMFWKTEVRDQGDIGLVLAMEHTTPYLSHFSMSFKTRHGLNIQSQTSFHSNGTVTQEIVKTDMKCCESRVGL